MDHFNYQNGHLYCEEVSVADIAKHVGTPVYIYSKATVTGHFQALKAAFAPLDPIVCYSIKSCANLEILRTLIAAGSGMDVVSGGELFKAQKAGCDVKKIVFAGVGKTDAEIETAIAAGIGWFNIESEEEFENIAHIAKRLGKQAHGALRVNPDVADARTHAKTATGGKETKFGVDIERAKRFFDAYGADAFLKLDSIHLHIGSPIYSPEPYVKAIEKALILIADLEKAGHKILTLDIGGGFAADYETGASPTYQTYADAIVPLLKPFKDAGGTIILEPGRTLIGNAGILVSQVLYRKQGGTKNFVIVDTGMTHLIRPTLYEAWMFAWPVAPGVAMSPPCRSKTLDMPGLEKVDIVGPICESGDYLAKERHIPPTKRGDLLAVFTAGAYGMVMASNYNAQPRPPEVLVDGNTFKVVRRRETYEDLVTCES